MYSRSSIPCRNGVDCYYLRQGSCWFYHPDWHENAIVSSESDNENLQISHSNQPRFVYNNINFANSNQFRDTRQFNLQLLGLQIDEIKKKCLQLQQKSKSKLQKVQEIQQVSKIMLGGQQVPLVKIYSDLPKQKSWFFEKSHHFHYFSKCQFEQCSICIQKFEVGQLLSTLFCKHAFHHQCINKWLKTADKCPLCRKDFRHHNQFKSMKGFIEPYKKPMLFWRDISVSGGSQNSFENEVDYQDGSDFFDDGEFYDDQYMGDDVDVDVDDDFGFEF